MICYAEENKIKLGLKRNTMRIMFGYIRQ